MHHDSATPRSPTPAPPSTSQVAVMLHFNNSPSASRERTEDAVVIGALLGTLAEHRATQKPVTNHDHHRIDHQQRH
jgi:hypothetical protein